MAFLLLGRHLMSTERRYRDGAKIRRDLHFVKVLGMLLFRREHLLEEKHIHMFDNVLLRLWKPCFSLTSEMLEHYDVTKMMGNITSFCWVSGWLSRSILFNEKDVLNIRIDFGLLWMCFSLTSLVGEVNIFCFLSVSKCQWLKRCLFSCPLMKALPPYWQVHSSWF